MYVWLIDRMQSPVARSVCYFVVQPEGNIVQGALGHLSDNTKMYDSAWQDQ